MNALSTVDLFEFAVIFALLLCFYLLVPFYEVEDLVLFPSRSKDTTLLAIDFPCTSYDLNY